MLEKVRTSMGNLKNIWSKHRGVLLSFLSMTLFIASGALNHHHYLISLVPLIGASILIGRLGADLDILRKKNGQLEK